MGLNRVSFKSGSKNVKFDYNSSYKDKIKKGILQITNNGTVRLSSNSKENIDKINTLEKILGRKHVTLKAYDTEEGAYVKYELNNLTKKTWKKVISDYKKNPWNVLISMQQKMTFQKLQKSYWQPLKVMIDYTSCRWDNKKEF